MINIAFIGLGVMGSSIASHLLNKNVRLTIYNRSKKKCLKFKRKYENYSIKIVDSPLLLAKDNKFIFSCVGNDDDIKEIYLSKKGIINNVEEETYIIDHTTSSSEIAIQSFKEFKRKKSYFIDAPVSGGEIGAKKGELSIMVGGEKKAFNKIKNFLNNYSKSLIYMGNSGSGQTAKMVNQICVSAIIQGLAEGLNFGKVQGLEINNLLKAISNGAAQSWQMDNRALTMWKNKFNFGFMNKWMYKDLKIVKTSAKDSGIPIPITNKILNYYSKLIEKGYDKDDTSSLIRLLNKK